MAPNLREGISRGPTRPAYLEAWGAHIHSPERSRGRLGASCDASKPAPTRPQNNCARAFNQEAAAAAEGLTLVRANKSSGLRSVFHSGAQCKAKLVHNGEHHYPGSFNTPKEAALCIAQWLRDNASDKAASAPAAEEDAPCSMAAEAAIAAAAKEGLTLVRADNASGF